MNTLPIQMPSPTNAAADASSKTRQADEPNTGNSFQQTLKDEIADRKQTGADKVAGPDEAGKTAAAPRVQASAKPDTDKQDDKTTEPKLDGDPNAMAQLLALAGQFVQSSPNTDPMPDSTAESGDKPTPGSDLGMAAGLAPGSAPELVAGLAAGLAAGSAPGSDVRPAITAEEIAIAQTNGSAAPTMQPKLQTGEPSGAIKGKAAASKDERFDASLDQANLAQQPARGASEKTAPAVLAAIEISALKHGSADQNKEVKSPASPAAFASLQQAGLDKLEAKTSASADRIAPQVGTTGWNQAIGQKVVWMAKNEQMSASLSLNPPDLGPMKVVISVSDNIATANFVSAHPDVRQALETALPRLREMLGEAGIQLGQAHVGAGTSGDYGAQAEQQQNGRHTAQSGTASQSLLLDTHVPSQSVRQGLVDTFA